MMEPEEGGFSVSMPSAEVGTAVIGAEAASVAMPGAEVDTAVIGSEATSVAMSGAEVGTAVIGAEATSVAMPGAEVDTAVIGSEAASVAMSGAEIGLAVIGAEAPSVNIQHNHYYAGDPGEKRSAPKDIKTPARYGNLVPPKGYSKLAKDVFVSTQPIRSGTKVYKAFQQHANGYRRPLAVKAIIGCEDQNFREVQHLLTLASHPNIVQIIQSKVRAGLTGNDLYVIMERCGDQDLMDYLEEKKQNDSPLDFGKTMSFSKQILNGVKHIHRNKIVHRDLKPENILLLSDGENLKVTDFGISKQLRDGRSATKQTSLLGTDGFRAPETFTKGEISQKADIFSSGIIIYLLWSNGKHAYGEKVESRNHNITENINLDLTGLLISGKKKGELLHLIRWMLNPDPGARPTIEEVLGHQFFKSAPEEGTPTANEDDENLKNSVDHKRRDHVAKPLAKVRAVIGVIDEISKTIQTFNPSDKSWNVLHTMPDEISKKFFFCAIAVDQVISFLAHDGTNFKFNVVKPTEGWIELPKRSERGDIQAVELGGQVYVFGDRNRGDTLIEILSTDHTSWRKMSKPSPCCCEAITAAKGCIYTFGGFDGSHLRRSMKFDPNMDESWMNLPDMPTARSQAAAAEVDNKIYVAGGRDSDWKLSTATECFDLVTQTWTTLKPMNVPHYYFNVCVLDGKVYAVGSRHSFIIEEYNPATDTWKDVATVSDKDIPRKATFTLHL